MKILWSIIAVILVVLAGGLLFFLPTFNNSSVIDTVQKAENQIIEKINDTIIPTSPISVEYLRSKKIESDSPLIEQELSRGSNYRQYIASYRSEGYKIYGLLTIPNGEVPEGGFPAIVFNHGYIPPSQYKTTEKYVAYVDSLARNGFVVFKIDMRGHGNSEGNASGTYFSSSYTIDAISALKSLQLMKEVNPNRVGIWGHSMSGNLSLRAMLVSDEFKAGVIWAGAVYSYEDFAKYRISDNSYAGRPRTNNQNDEDENRESSEEVSKMRQGDIDVDFNAPLWKQISLTQNLQYLKAPIQLHHAINDSVVNIGYSRDLKDSLEKANKSVELFEYNGGGHNIESPYFNQAMSRTVEFFKKNL